MTGIDFTLNTLSATIAGLLVLVLAAAAQRLRPWAIMATFAIMFAWASVPIVLFGYGAYTGGWIDLLLAANMAAMYTLLAVYPSKSVRILAFALPFGIIASIFLRSHGHLPIDFVIRGTISIQPLIQMFAVLVMAGATLVFEARRSQEARLRSKLSVDFSPT